MVSWVAGYLRTDLTNLMADISEACTLICCCYSWKSVGKLHDVRSNGLGGFGLRLSEERDKNDKQDGQQEYEGRTESLKQITS
jgi:hypothetical protein